MQSLWHRVRSGHVAYRRGSGCVVRFCKCGLLPVRVAKSQPVRPRGTADHGPPICAWRGRIADCSKRSRTWPQRRLRSGRIDHWGGIWAFFSLVCRWPQFCFGCAGCARTPDLRRSIRVGRHVLLRRIRDAPFRM